jgi:hypothetical protein
MGDEELGDLRFSPVPVFVVLGKSLSPCWQSSMTGRWRNVLNVSTLTAPFFHLLLFQTDCHGGMSGTIYEYGALTIDGEEYIPFKQYAGKYILFVNVASY